MAIRYVNDFEFPAAAGYSESKPSKVTGPMFAKGGKVEKAPKGMMVVIGIGKPKHDAPMEKAKGGKVAKVMGEFGEGKLHSGSKKGPKVTNPKQAVAIALSEQRAAKKAKGGKIDSVSVKDIKSGKVPQSTDEDFYGKAKDMPMPTRRPDGMKKGGMKHDDAAQDKAMIKSMVKPDALKKADGGGIAPPRIASPLQAMAARSRSVPVAPRAPMIPPQAAMPAMQAAAPGGARIGVGMRRPGTPNVGAIRAAMARSASQAMPENAPSMMKKGGKVKC